MRFRQYYLTHDCPHCGAKDAKDEWGGARMWSTSWGHGFSCCSEECGLALAKTVIPDQDTKKGRKRLKALWEKLAGQAEHGLSGEPYPGYPWR
ncbi:hypothetical protein PS655_03229 [Pseudomonas fluorescens]|uniref:Uncharacterized protein n=1 Tax=Pseudomonas fluorescens TaxID=294 RepID=A0A5E6U288_PSEFL|nr:hypothetical protein PS655_03229 [Pseudomonas fluorescens]